MELIHLALGSNLGNRMDLLEKACLSLKKLPLLKMKQSFILESLALLGMKQPKYLNQVVSGFSELNPETLLEECNQIESNLGRIRTEQWGARTLDIDILSYGTKIIKTETLNIPHPELENRAFVLMPLQEICPEWVHPSTGLSIDQLLVNWYQNNQGSLPTNFSSSD